MSQVFLSADELDAISKIHRSVKEMNKINGVGTLEFDGYFTFQYIKDNCVVAEPNADSPDYIVLRGER